MTPPSSSSNDALPPPPPPTATEIRGWLVKKLGEAQHVAPAEIPCDEPLIAMGLDSMQFLVLVGELEQWLGCRFTDNPLIDHPTIDMLAGYLADQIAAGRKHIDPTQP